jgi:hypothetical protein
MRPGVGILIFAASPRQNGQRVLDSDPAPFAAIVELQQSNRNYLNAITPNNPSTLLFGPAVKNN